MIKRINLSFDLNTEDKEVYEIISKQRFKTNFVCKAVLHYINDYNKDMVTRKELRQILEEVLSNFNIRKNDMNKDNLIDENELPKEIFDMFSRL